MSTSLITVCSWAAPVKNVNAINAVLRLKAQITIL